MSKFFGWLLIVIGVLIAGTAGLCSVAFLSTSWPNPSPGGWAQGLPVVALFGGVPFVFGLACIFAGWVIRKPSNHPKG